MPIDYAGNSAAWAPTVPVPNKTDAISNAIMSPAWRANADQSAYLKRVWPFSAFSYGSGNPVWTVVGGDDTSVTANVFVDIPQCAVGDKIHVTSFMSFKFGATLPANNTVQIRAIDNVTGTPVNNAVPGTNGNHVFANDASIKQLITSAVWHGVWTVATAGKTRLCMHYFTNGSLDDFFVYNMAMMATRFAAP